MFQYKQFIIYQNIITQKNMFTWYFINQNQIVKYLHN